MSRAREEGYVDVDAVPEQVGLVVAVENDAGTVQQRNVPVDLDFLRSHARPSATCTVRVKPAVEDTPTARERFNELMSEDLPTFG